MAYTFFRSQNREPSQKEVVNFDQHFENAVSHEVAEPPKRRLLEVRLAKM